MTAPVRISIVATPEAMASPVSGLFELFSFVGPLAAREGERDAGGAPPFDVEIVGAGPGPIQAASGLPIAVHRSIEDVRSTDVVIVPSMQMRDDGDWTPGRHPRVVAWLRAMHAAGATLCSTCSGGLLTAETGLLDGHEATVHWISEASFRRRHPAIRLRPDRALVVSGDGRLVTSGASTAWHDLALYLIARHVGPATAHALARFMLVQWHRDGQAPFQVFDPPSDHGDAAIAGAQHWIASHVAVANPVQQMQEHSGLAPRTFKRRFAAATGHPPVAYVQRLRIERAKRMLERGEESIETISWAVGYEDAASFRRLFKRLAGCSAGEYRRQFRMPAVLRG